MTAVWNTKFGPRRVRQDLPTLEEAIVAARGLTDDVQAQIEIAASLIDMPADEVRAAMAKASGQRMDVKTVAFTSRTGAPRAVVVERKPTRRIPGKLAPRGR
jgi:hypothetical protein